MTVAIWWIRRDLRLADNPALAAALAHADEVVPLFVLDPFFATSPFVGDKRRAFLWGGLGELAGDLQRVGGRLIIRRGQPLPQLRRIVQETGANAIFAGADHAAYARRRDAAVTAALPLRLVDGLTVHPPNAVLKPDGSPYTVFTPFSRAWKTLPRPVPQPAPAAIVTPDGPASDGLPAIDPTPTFPPGEAEALRRLLAFTAGRPAPLLAYGDARNRMDVDGTAQLSPYLRFGMISPRQAVAAADAASDRARGEGERKSAETWLNELIWREFYQSILYHHPHVLGRSFRPEFEAIRWSEDAAAFAAWCAGSTGYPIVDAAMRQLVQTGWMHNRARMITASFLVKDLLIDWRWGERFFMQHLIDGDPAANNGGWQWTAGVGTDAAPYFRVFNPVLQSAKFDPDGVFIRRWLPELAAVPTSYLHAPWTMPTSLQQAAHCIIGRDYPAPIVDHAWARERALAAYRVQP
ncbi:MAG: DNA photolyase family protein [Caldilineales bacterium]|nr:DNA photolyase family protein [Caldilineales bacterium]